MARQDKDTIKGYFVSASRPNQTQFEDLVDSYQNSSDFLQQIASALVVQQGVVTVSGSATSAFSILPLDLGGTGEGSLASATQAFAQGGLAILASANTFTENNTFTKDVIVSGLVSTSALMVQSSGVFESDIIVSGAIYSVSASGGPQGSSTINVSQLFDDGDNVEATRLDTPQDTSSGSSFTFTSPFATTTRIIVMFEGVSVDDTDNILIRLGDAGGVEATGYVSTSTAQIGATEEIEPFSPTTGFGIRVGAAARILTGIMTISLSNETNNTWISSHAGKLTTADTVVGGGQKDLSEVLTTITLVDSGGDDFDAGEINVRWYGY